jgi:hypothetical protein
VLDDETRDGGTREVRVFLIVEAPGGGEHWSVPEWRGRIKD